MSATMPLDSRSDCASSTTWSWNAFDSSTSTATSTISTTAMTNSPSDNQPANDFPDILMPSTESKWPPGGAGCGRVAAPGTPDGPCTGPSVRTQVLQGDAVSSAVVPPPGQPPID